jgi:hypothetical protein
MEVGIVAGSSATRQRGDFAAPLAGAGSGRLEFSSGASQISIRTDAGMPDLFRAHFEGPEPRVQASGGTVTIEYRRSWLFDWLRFGLVPRNHSGDITLNGSIPWQIAVRGGAAGLSADLSGIQLMSFDVKGGASNITLTLGRPSGAVAVAIDGAASTVRIVRPSGVAVRLAVDGAAVQLSLDDQRFGALGGGTQLQSGDYPTAADRYDVRVKGGASNVSVTNG